MYCIRSLSAVLCLLVVSVPAIAQVGDPPLLRVAIKDSADLPVQQARITIRGASGGASFDRVTDSHGEVKLALPLQGRYLVQVRALGFADESQFVDWRNDAATLDIRLSVQRRLEQVTVTSGSRVEELLQDSAVKVEVVTRQDMINTGNERLSDVLAEIPGIVTRSGSSATVSSEQIDGISARQIAVLQDGLPMIGARGIKSGNLNLNRQSTGRLERVEVVKGAASALYGTDAIGGVINMITREPTQKVQGNLNFSGGTLGAFDGRGDIGTRYKNLTLFLDLEQHRQDAYRLIPNSTSTVGPDLRRNDLLFKTRYIVTPRAAFSFTANAYHNRESGRSVGETGPVAGVYNDSVQNYALVGDFVLTSHTTLQLRGYSARYDENSRLDSLGPAAPASLANLNERYKRLDGTISHQLGSRNLLQGGYEWVQDNYRGANRLVGDNAGVQVTSNDVWLQDKFQLTSRATLDVGGRITSHSLFGTWAVPKVGLAVKLTNRLTARASFGNGFRAPDLGQLYYRFANPASFYQVIGNPTLRPEKSRSFSTGVDYRIRSFHAGLGLFRNDVRDLIDTLSIGTPTTPVQLKTLLTQYGIPSSFTPLLGRQTFIYQNFNRVYTQGFELNVEKSITRQLVVKSAYTYLDAKDSVTGLGLPQRHKHQGSVKAEYSNPRLGLMANIRGAFYSKWLLNPAARTSAYGYGIWDVYVSKNLRRGLQGYVSVDNLANSRDRKLALATPAFDRPDYGRQFRVGIRWQIGKE